MMSLLPVISHSCDSPTLALHKSFLFLLRFLPRPPPSLGVLSPSLSLSPSVALATCMPQRSLVVPGDATASVRVSSGGVCSQAGLRTFRFQSVQARATEHALGHEMHDPVLAEAPRLRAPTSVAWIPPPTRARRRHRGTHTWMPSFSVEHTFNIVNVSRMMSLPSPPPLAPSSALIK